MSDVPEFDLCVGIDYSGSKTPVARSATLQVYSADSTAVPVKVNSPAASDERHRNWNRKEVAHWIVSAIQSGQTIMAGIDHGFSFPLNYFQRYGISTWHRFLDDFETHWPTTRDDTTVDMIRHAEDGPPDRRGANTDLRLCDTWTPSAKSVFLFDVQGSVAKSTHAGLPWLKFIRDELGDRVHFWPFDGWQIPAGKSVLAEVFPSVFRRRFAAQGRTADQQHAYSVAQWLATAANTGILSRYLDPPLSAAERKVANLEGWILGVC